MQLPYRFGRYVLTQRLAQGGMAEIFKAQYLGESGFSKEVVIKRLLPVWSANPEFAEMLVDEAKALVHLSHPNIVQVFELGRDGKTLFISMEYVDGTDLRRLSAPLPLPLVFFIIGEILKGLDYAHQKKDLQGRPLRLVHRDISPQNILLSREGRVKIADFGIARGRHRSHETTQATVKGKYAYMSPEQARGEVVDAQTDLYAAGILLYELLEGKKLFDGVNDLATLEQVRQSHLPGDALKDRPAPLRAIVFKALQKEKQHRYETAQVFLSDLNRFAARAKYRGDAAALEEYLQPLMVRPSETVVEEIGSLETHAKIHPAKKVKWNGQRIGFLATSLALLFLMGPGWNKPAEGQPQEGQTRESAALRFVPFLPEAKGSITIDARPRPLQGTLILDGQETLFVTPFHLGDLDLKKERAGFIRFRLQDGKEVSEKFVLSRYHPDWVKTFAFKESLPALLRVAARPWGLVTVPGIVNNRETPLAGVPLKKGKYRVRIDYPPENRSVEKEITVADSKPLLCQADFTSEPKIICK